MCQIFYWDKICKYQQLSGNMVFLAIQPVVEYNLTMLNNVWSMFLRAIFNKLFACINIFNINDNELYYYLQVKKQVYDEVQMK